MANGITRLNNVTANKEKKNTGFNKQPVIKISTKGKKKNGK